MNWPALYSAVLREGRILDLNDKSYTCPTLGAAMRLFLLIVQTVTCEPNVTTSPTETWAKDCRVPLPSCPTRLWKAHTSCCNDGGGTEMDGGGPLGWVSGTLETLQILEGDLCPDIPSVQSCKSQEPSLVSAHYAVCQLRASVNVPQEGLHLGIWLGRLQVTGPLDSDVICRKGETPGFRMNRPSPTPEPHE